MAYSESKIGVTHKSHPCNLQVKISIYLFPSIPPVFYVYIKTAITQVFRFRLCFTLLVLVRKKKIKPTRLLYVKSSNVNNLVCEDLTFNL